MAVEYGLMASALLSRLGRLGLSPDIASCSWASHLAFTVPLFN